MFCISFIITFVIFLAIGGYFLPSIIACIRKKKNIIPIFLLNIFFGMTFIGWVGALIWALMYEDKDNY